VFELRVMWWLVNLMRFGRILNFVVGFLLSLMCLNFELADFDDFGGFYCYFHDFLYFLLNLMLF